MSHCYYNVHVYSHVGNKCSIATVGDDNALSVTTLSLVVGPQVSFTVDTQCSNLSAHSSSITGTHYPVYIASVISRPT